MQAFMLSKIDTAIAGLTSMVAGAALLYLVAA